MVSSWWGCNVCKGDVSYLQDTADEEEKDQTDALLKDVDQLSLLAL